MVLNRISYKILFAATLASLGFYQFHGGDLTEYFSEQWCWYFSFDDAHKITKELEKKYSIVIKYDVNETVIPESLRNPPSNGTAETINKGKLCRYLDNIALELKKYPSDVINQNLSAIYLFNSLSFFGVDYGGTSIGDAIFLTAGSKNEGYSNDYFSSLLHHEISSVFYGRYQFPTQAWSSINPDSFHYAESDIQVLQAIERGNKPSISERLYHDGFLDKYGQSTIENDFNLYAEMAFTQPQKLKSLAKKYPRIYKKAELIRSYYTGISKDFSLDIITIDSAEK
jgi:hypothetical protein